MPLARSDREGGPRMILLVTGGAGYVGAHVARVLLGDGHRVVVVDDLTAGIPGRLPVDAPMLVGSVLDTDLLIRVMRDYGVQGVVHLAGYKSVEESIAHPLLYYTQNVQGMTSLLTAMVAASVPRIVFSSSAAVYGTRSEERRVGKECRSRW